METENVPNQSENISVSNVLQYVIDRCGTDEKAIRHDGNIVLHACFLVHEPCLWNK